MRFKLRVRNAQLTVRLSHERISLATTEPVEILVAGEAYQVAPGGDTVVSYGATGEIVSRSKEASAS